MALQVLQTRSSTGTVVAHSQRILPEVFHSPVLIISLTVPNGHTLIVLQYHLYLQAGANAKQCQHIGHILEAMMRGLQSRGVKSHFR